MAEMRRDPSRPPPAERYLGVAGAAALGLGAVAICGSPAALWSYAEAVGGTIWSIALALVS
jgi:hypothetical protein